MAKLVVIEIGDGNFKEGFPVSIRIGQDRSPFHAGQSGRLPGKEELKELYTDWQSSYRSLVRHSRIKDGVRANISTPEIMTKGDNLKVSFNEWLKSQEFSPIKTLLERELHSSEEIRVIVQTDSIELQQLPWHCWEVFNHYKKADVAFSPRSYTPVSRQRLFNSNRKIKILATFGNSTNLDGSKIDNQKDWKILQQHLVNVAELIPLTEPTTENLSTSLRQHKPDIFFYAGHSSSQLSEQTGQMDRINLRYLESAFKDAVADGLKLAIFNSCDGLGIAQHLGKLQIPQVIIMREPIPDPVAHRFLDNFIKELANNTPLYLALRKARERLDILEEKYPGVTSLPVIFQDLTEQPLSLNDFQQSWSKFCFKLLRNIKVNINGVLSSFNALLLIMIVLLWFWWGKNLAIKPIKDLEEENNVNEVNQTAQTTTVLINSQIPKSGAIIAKRGQRYYVLTLKHIFELKDRYEIIAPDGIKYPVNSKSIKSLKNLDLAILYFDSKKRYNIARLGNSERIIEGTPIYVAGWSRIDNQKKPLYNLTRGFISSRLASEVSNGYALIYTSVTRDEMQGGLLLDKHGCMIGIHGYSEQEAIRDLQSAQTNLFKNGFNQGIPINKFLELGFEKELGQMEKCN